MTIPTRGGSMVTRSGALGTVTGRGAAEETILIDSFEDESMADWSGLSTSDWDFRSDNAVEGSTMAYNNSFENGSSVPGDGLPEYYSRGDGDLVIYFYKASLADFTYFVFGDDGSNGYRCDFDWGGNEFSLYQETDANTIFSTTASWNTGHVRLQVTWDDGSLGGSAGDITMLVEEWDNATQTTGAEYVNATVNDDAGGHDNNEGFGLAAPGSSEVGVDYLHMVVPA